MTRFLQVVSLVIVFLALTACMQVDTVVKVKADGSGTIEETFLMKKEVFQQMKKMAEEMAKSMAQMMTDGENGSNNQQDIDSLMQEAPFEIFDEDKLKENAKDKGEGVAFLRGTKINTDEFEGYKAIYVFEDISKVKINQNPEEKIATGPQQGYAHNDLNGKEYVVFAFRKGSPAELIIKAPKNAAKSQSKGSEGSDVQPSQKTDKTSEEMTAYAKELFQGMKIAVTVEVDGDIVETNASHREGSRITLVELDFGTLIAMPELFKRFNESHFKSMEESKVLLQEIPGIKVDLHDEIRISFK